METQGKYCRWWFLLVETGVPNALETLVPSWEAQLEQQVRQEGGNRAQQAGTALGILAPGFSPGAPQAEVLLHLELSLARLSSLLLLRPLHFLGDPSCSSRVLGAQCRGQALLDLTLCRMPRAGGRPKALARAGTRE